jgi:hypothetical protein
MMRLAISAAILGLLAPAAHADKKTGKTKTGKSGKGVYERSRVEVAPARNVALSEVSVDNRLGDVRIEGHDGKGIIIFAYKKAPDNATLERLKVKLVPDPAGRVRIGTSLEVGRESRPIAKGSIKIDLVIRAPRSAHAKARVWNGKLAVLGMNNGAALTANHADIKVENTSGKVSTQSAAGNQEMREIVGAVDAQGMNGNLRFEIVRGSRLDAMVHRGNIEGRKIRSRRVSMRTTHGNVVLHGEAVIGSHYMIATYRGDIEVRLRGTPTFSVWARAPKGKVELPGSARPGANDNRDAVRAELQQGKGTAFVKLQSRFGNIDFKLVH